MKNGVNGRTNKENVFSSRRTNELNKKIVRFYRQENTKQFLYIILPISVIDVRVTLPRERVTSKKYQHYESQVVQDSLHEISDTSQSGEKSGL